MLSKNLENKLLDSVVRIYEGFYRQIKEDLENEVNEKEIVNDLNIKIDVIVDALGLEEKVENIKSSIKKEIDVENEEEIVENSDDNITIKDRLNLNNEEDATIDEEIDTNEDIDNSNEVT